MACPLPTATVLTGQPVSAVKAGSSWSSRPESWVLVVVARISERSAAGPEPQAPEQQGGGERHQQGGQRGSGTPASQHPVTRDPRPRPPPSVDRRDRV
jgi:hypothetical protein